MAFAVTVCGNAYATDVAEAVDAFEEAGGDAKFARTQMQDATKGTFIDAFNASADSSTGSQEVREFMAAAVASGNAGELGVATGTYSAQTAAIGLATTQAIGGNGGVISNRQGALMAERKASASEFGDNAALASIRMNQNLANRIWASPFYTYQDQKNKDGYAGYKYKAWGVSVGYDRFIGESFAVGGAFTFSKGDYEARGANDDNDIYNYGFSLYGQYYNVCNGFFATLAGGYNYGDNDWSVGTTHGRVDSDNHTNSWWIGGNIGWDFMVNENFTLTPTIGLFWNQAENSSYSTSGAIVQNYSKVKQKSFMMPVDLTATWRHQIDECSSVAFKVGGGYAYNFKRDRADGSFTYAGLGGNPIFFQGVRPERHSWNATAGITYTVRNVDFGIDYRYDGMKKFQAHRVAATVGLSF